MQTPIIARAQSVARRLAGRPTGAAQIAQGITPAAGEQPSPAPAERSATPPEVARLRAELAAELERRAREEMGNRHGR